MANDITLPPSGSGGTASPVVETIDTTGSGGPQRQVVTLGDRVGSANDVVGPIDDAAPSTDTAPSSLNGRLQRVAVNVTSMTSALGTLLTGLGTQLTALGTSLTSLIALFPTALTKAGALRVGGTTANPQSVLTRPANTTAYAQGALVASNTAAGSLVVPSFAATPAANGTGTIRRARLSTNAATGMGGVAFKVDFWSGAAPTFANGDGGAYAVATGAALWLGSLTFAGLVQAADGAYGAAVSDVGSDISFALAGTTIFWSLECISAAGFTPITGQQFRLTPEIFQD